MTIPAFTVHVSRLAGAPYTVTTIKVKGIVIRSQLGPLTDREIRAYVRDYMSPPPTSRLDDVKQFLEQDKKALARSARGGKKKSPTVNERGFLWRDKED